MVKYIAGCFATNTLLKHRRWVQLWYSIRMLVRRLIHQIVLGLWLYQTVCHMLNLLVEHVAAHQARPIHSSHSNQVPNKATSNEDIARDELHHWQRVFALLCIQSSWFRAGDIPQELSNSITQAWMQVQLLEQRLCVHVIQPSFQTR